MKKIIYGILFTAILVIAFSFRAKQTASGDPQTGKLVIRFKNYAGNDSLNSDSNVYKNELNQAFTVSTFKYYIGTVHLKKRDETEFISSDYFLINEDDLKSKQIILDHIPEGEYTAISFTLGVDSLHNCSGAQSGALDPVNGMFWAWNTGYIFLKLEGKAPASNSPGHIFEFHIGGYKYPNNCIKTVSLNLEKAVISSGKTLSLSIKSDASELFKSPVLIDFSKISSVTDFHNATLIAANYEDMFSILSVSNEK